MTEIVGMSIATLVLLIVGLWCVAVFVFLLVSAKSFTGRYLPDNESRALVLLVLVAAACFYGVYVLSPIGISITLR